MKVLELFAGSRSFSKVAEEMGMETFTTDIKPFEKIDLVIDILELDNDLLMQKLFEKGIDKIQDINPLKEGRFTQFLENTKTGDYVKKLTAPGTVSRGLIDRQIVTEGFGIKDLGYDTQFDPVGFDPQTEARKRYNPYR